MRSRRSIRYAIAVAALLFGVVTMQDALAGGASFQQAVADYNSGNYMTALSELQSYKQSYPNNVLVHYYCALCNQALNRLEAARADYQYVAQNGDPNLKSMSQMALQQLSRVRSQPSQMAVAALPSSDRFSPSAGSSSSPRGKVKKILEFSADW